MDTVAVRTQVLEACGASPAEQEELLAYNQNLFDGGATPVDGGQFTLVDEPHVEVWRNYLHLARQLGVYPALALALVQLQFPIQAGISTTENYRLATRKGQLPPPLGYVLDELIADYFGILAAQGRYRADWFLRFVGLEQFPHYRPRGRLHLYLGEPPLSEGAFRVLQALVKAAAENLERFDQEHLVHYRSILGKITTSLALVSLTLEELASDQGPTLLQQAFDRHYLHHYLQLSPAAVCS